MGRREARNDAAHRHGSSWFDRSGGIVGLLADDDDPLTDLDGAVPQPSDGHSADVIVGREVCDEELEGVVGYVLGGGRVLDHQLEERSQTVAGLVEVEGRRSRLRIGEDHGKVDLLLVGAKVQEEFVNGV